MSKDVNEFVFSCARCAQSKLPRHLPAGKLMPLLPLSEGMTTIMVTIDRFSRCLKLIPLPQLPTALQMSELLFSHMFTNFGIPEDIVSDRKVCKGLMEKLGIQ